MSIHDLDAKQLGLDVGHSPLFARQMFRELENEDYMEVIRLSLDLARCRGYLHWQDQKKVQDFLYKLEREVKIEN